MVLHLILKHLIKVKQILNSFLATF